MTSKDIISKFLQKDNLIRIIFNLCYTLIGIALIIIAHVLNSKYGTPFLERLELYSILNILMVILADVLIIVVIVGNINTPPDIQKDDLNISSPYKKVRKVFMEQLEKHIVNDNSEYHKLQSKNIRVNRTILIVMGILFLLYIPIFVLQTEIVSYIQSLNLADNDFKFFYVIVIKITIDVLVLLMLAVRKLDAVKTQKDKLVDLFPTFRELQKRNMDILSIKTGTKAYPGKGIVLRDEHNIDLSNYSSLNRTLEEELVLMHELAKFIVYKNRNAKDIVFYALFILLSFMFSAFLFENYTIYFIIFFLIFLVIIMGASIFSQYREDYSVYAKWTLGFELPKKKTESLSGVDHPLFDLDDLD